MKLPAIFTLVSILLTAKSVAVGPEPADLTVEPAPPLASGLFAEFNQPCGRPAAETPRSTLKSLTAPKSDPSMPMTRPEYPATSRQFLEMGTVLLKMYVNEQGKVAQAHVFRSSGWPRLDNAALQHSRLWQLVPGLENGAPACMWVFVPVVFDMRAMSYAQSQLEATEIKPEAEILARQLFGIDATNERLTLRAMGMEGSREDLEARLFRAVADLEETRSALRDVAAMLSIELSAAEMQELTEIWRSPAFRKFNSLQSKMMPDNRSRQQRLVLQGRCISQEIDRAPPKDFPLVDSNGRAPITFLNALPNVVDQLGDYCGCVSSQQQRGNIDRRSVATKCGSPPKVTW